MGDGDDRRQRCQVIIHGSSAVAGTAAAAAWFPGSDAAILMPIQIGMVTAIAKEYGHSLSTGLIKSTIYATLGKIVGKAGAGLLVRYLPVAGNLARASVAVSVTEAIGWMAVERLETGEGLA